MPILLQKSTRSNKKWMVSIPPEFSPRGKPCLVHFGAAGYEDYTIHRDHERMLRYVNRHQKREDWNKSGICTPGFWSRWLLWNKPSLTASIKDTEKKFQIKIKKY